MYEVTVDGLFRKGTIRIENSSTKLTEMEIIEPLGDSGADYIEVSIYDENTKDSLWEVWGMLWGTPKEIVGLMDTALPMSKVETEVIMQHLDECADNSKEVLVYPATRVQSLVIKNSVIQKTIRAAQHDIISLLYEIPKLSITLLKVHD